MFKKFMAYLVVGCAGVVSIGIAYKAWSEHPSNISQWLFRKLLA